MSFPKLNLIVAACNNRGIGKNGQLPWRLRGDMNFFKKLTSETENKDKQNVVIMGRKTFFSIPEKFRPLANRINVLLSRTMSSPPSEGVILAGSLKEAISTLSEAKWREKVENIYVIGGSSIYEIALESPDCNRIYLTRVMGDFQCDTFLPEFDTDLFRLVSDPRLPEGVKTENDITYKFEVYEKIETSLPDFNVVVAMCDGNRGFAQDNDLPWRVHLPTDYTYYTTLVATVSPGKKNLLIHGRNCWEVLAGTPEHREHSENVLHVVVSTSLVQCPEGAHFLRRNFRDSLSIAQELALDDVFVETIYVMGGQRLYEEAVAMTECRNIYLTRVLQDFDANRFFPHFEEDFKKICFADKSVPQCVITENGVSYQFEVYERSYPEQNTARTQAQTEQL